VTSSTRGLEVSPSSLLQNELIQRQIGNRLAQPAVLELKVLQARHLLGLQPTELLAPPIIRHLAHADLADCVRHVLALRDQNIDLPQLRDDLFGLVSLPLSKTFQCGRIKASAGDRLIRDSTIFVVSGRF
jgi:hypothetical protein